MEQTTTIALYTKSAPAAGGSTVEGSSPHAGFQQVTTCAVAALQNLQARVNFFYTERSLPENFDVEALKKHSLIAEGSSIPKALSRNNASDRRELITRFAYVHGDSFIRGTRFERDDLISSIELLSSFFSHLLSHDLLILEADDVTAIKPQIMKLQDSLSQIRLFHMTLDTLIKDNTDCSNSHFQQKLYDYATSIAKKLYNLSPGSSYSMAGGWRGPRWQRSSSHSMVYTFTKRDDGHYNIEIYSTGKHAENYHNIFEEGNKQKICPFIRYRAVSCEKLFFSNNEADIQPDWFLSLLEPLFLPRRDSKLSVNPSDIYQRVFGHLSSERVSSRQEIIDCITPPRAQINNWHMLTAMLFATVPEATYKQLKLELKLWMFILFYQAYKDTIPVDSSEAEQARTLQKYAGEKLMRTFSKMYKAGEDGVLSRDKALQVYATLSDAQDRLSIIEQEISAKRASQPSLPIAMRPRNANLVALQQEIIGLRSAFLHKPPKANTQIDTLPFLSLQRPNPGTLLATLQGAKGFIEAALKRDQKTQARVLLEELFSLLPVPAAESSDFWLWIPQNDLKGVMQTVEALTGYYSDLLMVSSVQRPEAKIYFLLAYAISHTIAVRIDSTRSRTTGEPFLAHYGAHQPLDLNRPFKVFYHREDWDRQKRLSDYFDTINTRAQAKNNGELFYFRSLVSSQQQQENVDDDFFDKLIKNNATVYEEVRRKNRFYSSWMNAPNREPPFSPDDVLAFELVWDIDIDPSKSPLIASNLDHLVLLRRVAFYADRANLYSKKYGIKVSIFNLTVEIETRAAGFGEKRLGAIFKYNSNPYSFASLTDEEYEKTHRSLISSNDLDRHVHAIITGKRGRDTAASPANQGYASLPNEAETLIKEDNIPILAIRELIRTGAQPHLFTYQLLYYFRHNRSLLAKPAIQVLFDTIFFKPLRAQNGSLELPLFEQLTAEPNLADQCIDLINSGLKDFWEKMPNQRPHVHACLFFVRLADRVRNLVPQPKQHLVLPNADKLLEGWLAIPDLSLEEKSAIHLHLLYHYYQKRTLERSFSEAEIQKRYISWIFYTNNELNEENNDPVLKRAAEQFAYTTSPYLQKVLDDQEKRNRFFTDLFQALSLPNKTSQQQWLPASHPTYRVTTSSDTFWAVNIETGKICNEAGSLKNTNDPRWKHSPTYQRLFGKEKLSYHVSGAIFYFKSSVLGSMRVVTGIQGMYVEFELGLEMERDGRWYKYITPSSNLFNQNCLPNTIPGFLKADHAFWLSIDPSKPSLITDLKTGKTVYLVCSNGKIIPSEDEGKPSEEQRYLCLCSDSQPTYDFGPLKLFEHTNYTAIWLKGADSNVDVAAIIFPRYLSLNENDLAFVVDTNGHAVWESNRQYLLAQDQKRWLFGHMNNYLLLKSKEGGKQKLLLPLRKILQTENEHHLTSVEQLDIESKDLSTTERDPREIEFNMPQRGQHRFLEYDLVDDKPRAKEVEGKLFLAYLYLGQRSYTEAFDCLREVTQSDLLSLQSQKIFEWILLSGERSSDFSPNAIAIRLYAYKTLVDYRNRPEFEQREKDEENEENKKKKEAIDKEMRSGYSIYLDGIQNVVAPLRLPKEDEVGLIERALGTSTFHRRYYDLTHDTPMPPIFSFAEYRTTTSFTEPVTLPRLGFRHTDDPFFDDPSYDSSKDPVCCPALLPGPGLDRNYYKERATSFLRNGRDHDYYTPPSIESLSVIFPQEGLNLSRDFVSLYRIAKNGCEAKRRVLCFRLSQLDIKDLFQTHSNDNTSPYTEWNLYNYLFFALQHPEKAPELPSNRLTESLYNFHKQLNIAYSKRPMNKAGNTQPIFPNQPPSRIRTTFPPIATQPAVRCTTPTGLSFLLFTRETDTFETTYPLSGESFLSCSMGDKRAENANTICALGDQDINETERNYLNAIQIEFAAFADELNAGRKRNDSLPHYSLRRDKNFIDIESEMSTKIAEQRERLEGQEKTMLAFANKTSAQLPHTLRKLMLLRGRSAKELKLNDLILLFLKGRKELFYSANSDLDEQDVTTLYQLIGKYLINATHLQQWQRGDVHARKLAANDFQSKEERDYLIEQLGYELFTTRTYDNGTAQLNPEREVPFLVFEYFSNIRIRPEQYNLLYKMTERGVGQKRYRDIVIQLIMGAGKTSVFASILGHLAAKPGRLSLFVTPASQFSTVIENLKNTQRRCFHQEIDSIDLSRNTFTRKNLSWIYSKLKKAMEREEMVVIKSETIQALELEFLSCAKDYISDRKNKPSQDLIQKIAILRDILLIFRKHSDVTIDEVDIVLNTLREVNFPIGEAEQIKAERIDVVKTIMSLLVSKETIPNTNQTMEELSGVRRNEQALLSQVDYQKKVQPFLASKLAEAYAPFAVALEHKSSLVRYFLNTIPQEVQTLTDHKGGRAAQQEVEKAQQWYNRQANQAEIEKDIAFLVELGRRAVSSNPTENEQANLMALAKHVIQDLLPATLSKSCGRHFGRSKSIENAGEILPFQGVDTPSPTTKFGYYYELATYHFLTVLSKGVTPYQIMDLANKFKVAASQRDEPFDETAEAEKFLRLTGVSLADIDRPGKVEEAVENLRKETSKLLDIETETIALYVSFCVDRFNSTPQNFVDQFADCRAMAGVLWNAPGYHEALASNIIYDRGSEGRIVDIMLQRAEKLQRRNIHTVKSAGAKGLLREALFNHPQKEKFHGIIDIAGHFKELNNTCVAREILEYFENDERIDGVLFYIPQAGPEASISERKNSGKLAIMKKGASSHEVIGGTSKELIEAVGIPIKNLFVYYDESHTTGSDILQPPTSKNFVIVGERLMRRNFFQGILRLRQFFFSQDAEFVVPDNARSSLLGEGSTVLDLINSGIKYQAICLAMDNYRSFKQQISNVFRKKALEKLLNPRTASDQTPEDIARAIGKEFEKYQKVLLATSSDSPYAQFGRVEQDIDTIDNLQRYAERALNNFPRGQEGDVAELRDELRRLIERAQHNPILPKKVPKFTSDIIGLEEEVEMALEQEAQLEVELELELEQELKEELQRYLSIKPREAVDEIEWGKIIPKIKDLVAPSSPSERGFIGPGASPLRHNLSNQTNKFSSYFFFYEHNYHDIFDNNIFATKNFFLTGKEAKLDKPHSVFSKYQKPGNQILAMEHEGKMSFLLLSSYDAEIWKRWLGALESEDARHMWLIQPDSSLIQGNMHRTPLPIERHGAAISRALLQINFFNGNARYLDQHVEETKQWFNESHLETKLRY
ncbi:DUF3638 domain-containing protein, partial [Simkania negevensis]|nr:DUF3638 domain-containing protein [Simkania negevensis]